MIGYGTREHVLHRRLGIRLSQSVHAIFDKLLAVKAKDFATVWNDTGAFSSWSGLGSTWCERECNGRQNLTPRTDEIDALSHPGRFCPLWLFYSIQGCRPADGTPDE